MQDDEYPRTYSGQYSPAAGWPPGGAAPAPAVSAVPAAPLRRVRAGVVVLVAVVFELVLIGGADNQWASRKIADAIGTEPGLGTNAARSWLVYAWRAGAARGDTFHAWAAQLALIGTVVVLTALLVWAAARGTGGFGRVFLGTWTAVVAATQLAVVVAGVVVDPDIYGYPANRLDAALFGGPTLDVTVRLRPRVGPPVHAPLVAVFGGPDGATLVAGLGLGLLVALAAGLTAVLARRRVVPAGRVDDDEDDDVGFFESGAGYASARQEPYAGYPQRTQQLPRMDAPRESAPDDTTTLPRVQGPPYAGRGQGNAEAPRDRGGYPDPGDTGRLPRQPE